MHHKLSWFNFCPNKPTRARFGAARQDGELESASP